MEKNVKTAGVSLIEVMISMVLIALLLMAIVSIFPRMSSHRKGLQESDVAKLIAAETLEYLQWVSETNGCPNLPKPDAIDPQYKQRNVVNTTYYIRWSECSDGSSGFYAVTDTVRWKQSGKWHHVTVTGTIKGQ